MANRIGLFFVTALTAVSSTALAVHQPTDRSPDFETADGQAARLQRNVAHHLDWQNPAWTQFTGTEGGTWNAIWDTDTTVPLSIYGSGISVPGAVASADKAFRQTSHVLTRHLALLAPGASPSDFSMATNEVHRDIRLVTYIQHHRGIPVLGGSISFTIKRDRIIVIGSTAFPHINVSVENRLSSDRIAENQALNWVRNDYGADARITSVEDLVVVPIVRSGKMGTSIEYTTSLVVDVRTTQNSGLWRVYVSAADGKPVARSQMLRFGSGQMVYETPIRWPGGERTNIPAPYAEINVNGNTETTDYNGNVSWGGNGNATITARTRGPYIRVQNLVGGEVNYNGNLNNGGTANWGLPVDELGDAQVTTFVHLNIAKERGRIIDPGLSWLDQSMLARVNINDVCNAYFDTQDDTVNFFQKGSFMGLNCGNTARLPDVVYHEFGHAIHWNGILPGAGGFDGALSEGIGDYYAATITNDPAMGIGFFTTNEPLRHIDPIGTEATWPDDISNDTHITGLIFAGAMWDTRKALVASLGEQEGVALADQLFYAALQRAGDIPSVYAAVLAEDDDDGNLANGTPNSCLINPAFVAHGLAPAEAASSVTIAGPNVQGLSVSFDVIPPANANCPVNGVASASVQWQIPSSPGMNGSEPMSISGSTYSASLPIAGENFMVEYSMNIQYDNGTSATYPSNLADPRYQMFIGATTAIYCTDFETDPFADGWTNGSSVGANDWSWGAPGGANEDPDSAYSGNNVIGNNLNGRYPSNTINYVDSPVIDVSGYDNVRLQYRRWLYVEDGFYDDARISANGTQVWENLNSNAGPNSSTHHTDREWRFHDVDLTDRVSNNNVQVRFELQSDGGLEFGGWTIDDFCLVSYVVSECGDGQVTSDEECDNGGNNNNSNPDACRTDCVAAYCGDGVTDTNEQCDDGNNEDGDSCSNACLGENPATGGCCDANQSPSSGTPALVALVMLFLALTLRRRRFDR